MMLKMRTTNGWPPNGFTPEEQFPVFFNSKPGLSREYSVIGIVSGCATHPAYNSVEVIPAPAPYLGEDGMFCDRKEPFMLSLKYFDT